MSRRLVGALAAGCLAVVAIGVPVAAVRHGGSHDDASGARVAPLSADDRRVLAADRALVESLPVAFSQVPQAVADVAGISRSEASAALNNLAAVKPLAVAASGHSPSVAAFVAACRDLTSGKATATDLASLPQSLVTLQTVEGDVVPAVRAIALQHGRKVSAEAVLAAIKRDHATAELGRVLASWSQIYGVLVLVEQAAQVGQLS